MVGKGQSGEKKDQLVQKERKTGEIIDVGAKRRRKKKKTSRSQGGGRGGEKRAINGKPN